LLEGIKSKFLESLGKRVVPYSSTIRLIQDKLLQKQTLEKAGIPVARYLVVRSENDFQHLVEQFGLPFILKSRIK
jgi:5-(carboxyamino)imidazole ribonucleotide synthase